MDLAQYKANRRLLELATPKPRNLCTKCLQPPFGCYCGQVEAVDPGIDFVILMHPMEAKRRIATGRMSHLCLKNSRLVVGKDFSDHREINRLIENAKGRTFVLYPGPNSRSLTELDDCARKNFVAKGERALIFVIDGTWRTVRPMIRSANLAPLPRICFSLPRPSGFQIRKQPAPGCFSTIEAIHQTIELIGRGPEVEARGHDILLTVFHAMVERQIQKVPSRRSLTNKDDAKEVCSGAGTSP
jgi:DTW domain-containing protein